MKILTSSILLIAAALSVTLAGCATSKNMAAEPEPEPMIASSEPEPEPAPEPVEYEPKPDRN